MGFFSELLTTIAPIAGAFAGIPQVAPTALAPAVIAPLAKISAPPSGTVAVAGTRALPGFGPIDQKLAEALFKAAGSPTGGLRKRTIIQTFDPGSGFITRIRMHDGGVAVFAADVAAARRINRQVRKLDARLPRKLVKESKIKQLTDRVIKNALEHAGDPHVDGVCPK